MKISIATATVAFLDHLERLRHSNKELPLPFAMLRIRKLLARQLIRQVPLRYIAPVSIDKEQHEEGAADSNSEDGCSDSPSSGGTARCRAEDVAGNFVMAVAKIAESRSPCVIDVMVLHSYEGPIIKEFAASCQGCPTACITVRVPIGSIPNNWVNEILFNHFHGISWNSGVVDEEELKHITAKLFDGTREIRVKGLVKIKSLAEQLDVPESRFTDIGPTPTLQTLLETNTSERCSYHRVTPPRFSCAMRNANVLLAHDQESM